MLDILKPFLTGLVTLLALDLAWIGLVANQFYKRELAGLARMDGGRFAIWLGGALVRVHLLFCCFGCSLGVPSTLVLPGTRA